jgi:hypothetical protein
MVAHEGLGRMFKISNRCISAKNTLGRSAVASCLCQLMLLISAVFCLFRAVLATYFLTLLTNEGKRKVIHAEIKTCLLTGTVDPFCKVTSVVRNYNLRCQGHTYASESTTVLSRCITLVMKYGNSFLVPDLGDLARGWSQSNEVILRSADRHLSFLLPFLYRNGRFDDTAIKGKTLLKSQNCRHSSYGTVKWFRTDAKSQSLPVKRP